MERFYLEGNDEEPRIILDKEKNIFEISGRSILVNAADFYSSLIEWFEEYGEVANDETVVEFKFTYFNTASSKMLLDILELLAEIVEKGNNIKIKWYYEEDDEDMYDGGEQYSELVEIPFELISYEYDD